MAVSKGTRLYVKGLVNGLVMKARFDAGFREHYKLPRGQLHYDERAVDNALIQWHADHPYDWNNIRGVGWDADNVFHIVASANSNMYLSFVRGKHRSPAPAEKDYLVMPMAKRGYYEGCRRLIDIDELQ